MSPELLVAAGRTLLLVLILGYYVWFGFGFRNTSVLGGVKEEADNGVKGRFCGGPEVILIHLGWLSEGVGKVSESQVGKCQAEVETWSSLAACPWHGAAPTGRGG